MAYSNANGIRACEAALADTTAFTAQTLEQYARDYADPIIDAALLAAGFSVPLTTSTAPKLVATISAMLAAARALESHIGRRTAGNVERAVSLREEAWEYLDDLRAGKLDPGISRSTAGNPIIVDTDPETRHADAAVVGTDAEDWSWPSESRES